MQVGEQGRVGLVEPGAVAVLHDLEVAIVLVPAAVAGILLGLDVITPVHLHEGHAMLNEPAGEHARLAKVRLAVSGARSRRLAANVESFGCLGLHAKRGFHRLNLGIESLIFWPLAAMKLIQRSQ